MEGRIPSSSICLASLFVLVALAITDVTSQSTAVCTMSGSGGIDPLVSVYGQVIFTQTSPNDAVVINVNLFGFNATDDDYLHGLQIHTSGNITDQCAYIGPIFNPFNKSHGPPFSFNRKVGDLGNVGENWYGQVQVMFIDRMISLVPFTPNNIVGRSLAVFQYVDDYGQGSGPTTTVDGDVGGPLACCQIMGSIVPQPPVPFFPPRWGPPPSQGGSPPAGSWGNGGNSNSGSSRNWGK